MKNKQQNSHKPELRPANPRNTPAKGLHALPADGPPLGTKALKGEDAASPKQAAPDGGQGEGQVPPAPGRKPRGAGEKPASPPQPSPPTEERQRSAEMEQEEKTAESQSGNGSAFPIAGIGASAGGLGALEALLAHMPADSATRISFVIVQHLDPDHKSVLSELVRRYTRMRVFEVADAMTVEPDCVYIIPPNKDLALRQGKLRLSEPEMRRGLRLPIDFFFRSLAQDRGEQAIGIILSGNGTDGTLGLRAIKEAGGIAVVQEPQSAEYDSMPRSAISSGLADYVLPPAEMAAQLITYLKRTSPFTPAPESAAAGTGASVLKIMKLLRAHTGHDFSNYKENTVRRRVERRMVVNQVETLDEYLRLLRQKPAEMDTLFRELLIGVTGFFRDPPAFEALRELVLRPLLTEHAPGQPVRVWVPGCSTGEEAFSIAMLIQETAEKLGRDFPVQVFATDIDDESIDKARQAVYPASVVADLSPERLRRFFAHEGKDSFRIKKAVRDQLVFAEQDVIKDPPFSKLDLISCRNMLIYMEPVLQKRLLPLFHYVLTPGGYLFLGNSESIGEFANLFTPIERRWKLYRRKDYSIANLPAPMVPRFPLAGEPQRPQAPGEARGKKSSLRELTERTLLRDYAPACIAVNAEGEILYVHGRTGKYLELPVGEGSLNLVRSARDGLKVELANALRRVIAHRQPVHCHGLEVRTNGGFQAVNVSVELADVPEGGPDVLLVTFQEAAPHAPAKPAAQPLAPATSTPPDEKDRHIVALERELHIKAETLQSTIEELETSNEELKSTNEELQSTNEELQSTNEELETSKEELQSVNEELITVNSELQQKMDGLSRANNDMNNLLAGTGIGMLFVDHQLHIQRFTPAITDIIALIQSDIGRPVTDLFPKLAGYDRLGQDARAVLDSLTPREAEVRNHDGKWYLMRILPYRTAENVIEGAVMTFVDISAQKSAQGEKAKGEAEKAKG